MEPSNTIYCNLPNDQLSQKEFEKIEWRMYPGIYSGIGFLQEGEKLHEVIGTDQKYLESVGITYKQIADSLETIVGKFHSYKEKYGLNSCNTYIIGKKYEIIFYRCYGAQECPFHNIELDPTYHGCEYGSCDFTIKNIETNKKIKFNTLHTHMIRQHYFFEGPKSYRLEPRDVIEIFGLQPNVDYSSKYMKISKWAISGIDYNGISNREIFNVMKNYSLKVCIKNENMLAILLPSNKYIPTDMRYLEEYNHGLKNNLAWSDIRKLLYIKYNHDNYDQEKIKEEIANENKIIDQYKATNCLDKIYLFIFIFEEPINNIFHIENAILDMTNNCAVGRYCYKFVVKKYIPYE